jgi:hypothetical protein
MTEIMRVKIHSPSVKDFDPLSAIHLWNSSSTRGRRVNRQPYGERELEEEEELSEYSEMESDYELEPEDKYKFRIKQNYLNICLLLTFFNL